MLMLDICAKARKQEIYIPWILQLHCPAVYDIIFLLQQKKFNPYPTAFPYGNGMVLHFFQQQESSTTKAVHKVINKRLKAYV